MNIKALYEQYKKSSGISIDSRNIAKNSLFFALSGERHNGNLFAEEALNKGARLCIIDDKAFDKGDGYLLVENTLKALQELASYHRDQLSIPFIGITGSNGKTTTKELISIVLASQYRVRATEGNFNNHIGVPLTLLLFDEQVEIGIIEMGANHPGEIAMLSKIAKPDLGIITNIGKAHLEGFGSFEGVIRTKNELYDYVRSKDGKAIVHSDDELLMKLSENMRRFFYGSANAEVTGKILSSVPTLTIEWEYLGEKYICNTQLYGKYNLPNLLAAISFGVLFEISPEKINESLGQFVPKNNRSQRIETKNNQIILDAYNANPVSMKEAILSFNEMNYTNPHLILGDMFELGSFADMEHQQIVELIHDLNFQNVMLVGTSFNALKQVYSFRVFEKTEDAYLYLKNNPVKNGHVLIKGSRGMKLETLLQLL